MSNNIYLSFYLHSNEQFDFTYLESPPKIRDKLGPDLVIEDNVTDEDHQTLFIETDFKQTPIESLFA